MKDSFIMILEIDEVISSDEVEGFKEQLEQPKKGILNKEYSY